MADKSTEHHEHITGLDRILDDASVIDEDIIGIESGDIVNRIEIMEKYNRVKNRYGTAFYSDLIFILTNIRLNEKRAKEDWQNILRHKKNISGKLGRNARGGYGACGQASQE